MGGSSAQRNPWLYIGGIWVCVGLVQATQTVFGMRAAGMHHSWTRLFAFELISWLPWVLVTRVVIRFGRALPLSRYSFWPMHLAAIALIGTLCAGWDASLEAILAPWAPDELPGPFLATWLHKSYGSFFVSLVLYGLLLMVSYVVDSRQQLLRQQTEAARLSEQLSLAQLNALRRQIEPHFIFNALNCIAGMVRERNNDGAVSMIVALSDVLRRLTRESSATQVPLQREIEFLEKYLAIQKLRFADRLQVVMRVPEELRGAQVPSLILQPLVENAVKHGIAQRVAGGTVRVAVAEEAGELSLSVYNDGPPLAESWQTEDAGGLANLKRRLQLMFGAAAQLVVANRVSGVEVCVTLPYRECVHAAVE